jgi:hypothetical protein
LVKGGSASTIGAQSLDVPRPDADPPNELLRSSVERLAPQLVRAPTDQVNRVADQPSPSQAPWWVEQGRACDGCPWRRPGHAFIQTTSVNVFYGLGNLARGQVTARVTLKSWWANMKNGWVWDLDDFGVNQFGHPYQGNNYFTSRKRIWCNRPIPRRSLGDPAAPDSVLALTRDSASNT